ncbi:MAG: integrase core domain-containing protein [Rubrobacteraceae bacterium]
MARGRTCTREFKPQLRRQAATGEKRPAQLRREHNLSESVLLRWRKECDARGEAGAGISTASGSNPRENAKAESFLRSLKVEEVHLKDYRNFEEARKNIGEFIEEVYDKKRLRSSLGYLPPVEFEAAHALKAGS